jgi:hypothetical protein
MPCIALSGMSRRSRISNEIERRGDRDAKGDLI